MVVFFVVLVVVIVVAFWGVLGYLYSRGEQKEDPKDSHCEQCKQLDIWWNSLTLGGKILGAVHYAISKLFCLDCP